MDIRTPNDTFIEMERRREAIARQRRRDEWRGVRNAAMVGAAIGLIVIILTVAVAGAK